MDVGDWIEQWLSRPRFAVYLAEADGDRARALALYDWNARAAAAFLHDIGHLEVGLRNAYDRALSARDRPGDPHWVYEPTRHFPARIRGSKDANWWPRNEIAIAIDKARRNGGGARPASGKVVAELNFGFWSGLTTAGHEGPVWRRRLHRAFPAAPTGPPCTNRSTASAGSGTVRRTTSRSSAYRSPTGTPTCSPSPTCCRRSCAATLPTGPQSRRCSPIGPDRAATARRSRRRSSVSRRRVRSAGEFKRDRGTPTPEPGQAGNDAARSAVRADMIERWLPLRSPRPPNSWLALVTVCCSTD